VLICADARAIPLRDGCVQTIVTSPPWVGLDLTYHALAKERTSQLGLFAHEAV
jgi:hypothetical protein